MTIAFHYQLMNLFRRIIRLASRESRRLYYSDCVLPLTM